MSTQSNEQDKTEESRESAAETEELVYEPIRETPEKHQRNIMINSPDDAVQVAKEHITDPRKEHFIGLYMDSSGKLVHAEALSVGLLDRSLVHPRETFRSAIEHSASSVIVLHNHPSGEINPSPEDIELTTRLDMAGDLLGIWLEDHIIFNEDGESYSLNEHGHFPEVLCDDCAHHNHEHEIESTTQEQATNAGDKANEKSAAATTEKDGKGTETQKDREGKASKIIEKYATPTGKQESLKQSKNIERERGL